MCFIMSSFMPIQPFSSLNSFVMLLSCVTIFLTRIWSLRWRLITCQQVEEPVIWKLCPAFRCYIQDCTGNVYLMILVPFRFWFIDFFGLNLNNYRNFRFKLFPGGNKVYHWEVTTWVNRYSFVCLKMLRAVVDS